MSSQKDVENIVKGCSGIKFKSNRQFGPIFWCVQGGATHGYTYTKRRTHANTQTHARTHARTHKHTHTHTHTHTHIHDYTISNRSLFPYLRHPRNVQGTIQYRPGTFSILSETLSCTSRIPKKRRRKALKGVRQVKRIRRFYSHYLIFPNVVI